MKDNRVIVLADLNDRVLLRENGYLLDVLPHKFFSQSHFRKVEHLNKISDYKTQKSTFIRMDILPEHKTFPFLSVN